MPPPLCLQDQSPAHIASSFKVPLLFYLPSWTCNRGERTWDVCSKDICSNTSFSTCWPCEIECFLLSFLLPETPPPASCPPPPGLHGDHLRIQPEELCTYSLPHSPHFPPRLDALSYQPRSASAPTESIKVLVLRQNLTNNKSYPKFHNKVVVFFDLPVAP